MTDEKKDILNNLLVIYYELENIYNAINLSYNDFLKEVNIEREAVTIYLGRYFLIRYCAFYDELNHQFVENYKNLDVKLRENIDAFNFKVEKSYQIKNLRDTILAHNNRIRINKKYLLVSKTDISKFKVPISISEFNMLLQHANLVIETLPSN